ncbi:hypothetical protein MRX96_031679 [Rhipicephalus microplus]
MALNAATDQQYHLLDQDGTADDQMDQLQGDHDTIAGRIADDKDPRRRPLPFPGLRSLLRIREVTEPEMTLARSLRKRRKSIKAGHIFLTSLARISQREHLTFDTSSVI